MSPSISIAQTLGNQGSLRSSEYQLRKIVEWIDWVSVSDSPVVRAYRPYPTAAFSRRESHLAGFKPALDRASELGYEPILRLTGGRCVVFDQNSLVIDVLLPEKSRKSNDEVFKDYSEMFATYLKGLGVNSSVGQLIGEFCPGRFSVLVENKAKLIGIAQRVMGHTRLISASIQLTEPDRPRMVLDKIYRAMLFDWDPKTFSSLEEHALMFDPNLIGQDLHTFVCQFVESKSKQAVKAIYDL